MSGDRVDVPRQPTGDAGDQRLRPFRSDTARTVAKIALVFLAANLAATFVKAIVAPGLPGSAALDIDFRMFWAAAKLALAGTPLQAFDATAIEQIDGVTDGGLMAWLYPPGYMAILMPLGVLPFVAAWAFFDTLSLAAIAVALRPFTRTEPTAWRLMIAAPAFLPALWIGQNSLLWLAGLLGALACIRAERPIFAGALIGLLTLKPQLGLLIPVALLAAGLWRPILAATVTTIGLAVVPTLAFGIQYWRELAETLRSFGAVVRAEAASEPLMCSTFAITSRLGASPSVALAAQWSVAAVAALTVFLAWRRRNTGFDLQVATLLAAIPLASPYLWHYDTAFLAVTGLFLLRAGVLGFDRAGLAVFTLLWLGAGPALLVVNLIGDGSVVPVRFLIVPLMLLALALCLAALLRQTNPDPVRNRAG